MIIVINYDAVAHSMPYLCTPQLHQVTRSRKGLVPPPPALCFSQAVYKGNYIRLNSASQNNKELMKNKTWINIPTRHKYGKVMDKIGNN